MASANHKAMKHLYLDAIAVTTVVLNEWAPYRLIAGGAPKDEFAGEASLILARARTVDTPEALAAVVSEVFSSSFQPKGFTFEDCASVASRLFDELQSLGYVKRLHDAH